MWRCGYNVAIDNLSWFTLKDVNIEYLRLYLQIKYAIFYCVLDFFYYQIEKHCRSPPSYSFQKLKWIGGKTMQYKVDSYTLEYLENENKYYISFIDSAKQNCRIEIDKEIFDTYMNSKKAYIKIKNEASRFLEQSELTEEDIYNRAKFKGKNTEEVFMDNMEKEKIKQAKEKLTDTQIRRLELHIIDEITIRDLAKLEKVRKNQIEKSIQLGIKKFKKFFED